MRDATPPPRTGVRFALPSLRVAIGLLMLALGSLALAAPPAPSACGVARSFERCEDGKRRCERVTAYDVPDYWHGLAQCLRGLRDRWSRDGPDAPVSLGAAGVADNDAQVSTLVRRQVLLAMSASPVRFVAGGSNGTATEELRLDDVFDARSAPRRGFDRVVLLNDRGVAYNAMGQSGLSYFLFQMAVLADRGGYPQAAADTALYRALARGAITTVLTPVSAGGLAASRPCDDDASLRCTWYHSITRRDQPTAAGATLNQHLHAVRDLGLIADLLRKQRWNEGTDFNRAIIEGLNQLAFAAGSTRPGAPPNLADFLSPPAGKARVRWAYYGLNPTAADGRRAYFLGVGGKDCSYHLHVLDLFSQILQRAQAQGFGARYEAPLLACGSELAALQRAATLRRNEPNRPALWSDPRPGRDFACPAAALGIDDNDDSQAKAGFLDSRFAACPSP